MTKRIFRSICLVAIAVFAASVLLFSFVLYDYFSGVRQEQLRVQTELAAKAVAAEGTAYFDGLDTSQYRMTLIAPDGSVIFDSRSDSDEMENHLEREEIKEALENGVGESSRYSVTLMERALYCAKRLPDGSVLRMSVKQNTLLTLLLGMSQPLAVIILIAIALSMFLASRLSKQIVKPLNSLDLDDPLSNEGYDELSPLLKRIDVQQRQIKNQADELRKRQEEFEAVTENMSEGIVVLNTKGVILSINRAAEKLFDASHSCVGQHMLSVNRSAEISALLSEAEKGVHAERTLELKGRKYQLNISPVSEDEKVTGAVLLILDVTEKEQAEQMRREFTANVSHELKTPLQIIAGSAELLENGIVKEEDRLGFYSQIRGEARRMIWLVEDIIRLSHLDEGADDMKQERVDLYKLTAETVSSLVSEAESAGVSLSVDGESAIVNGIPQLLESVVYNLTDNAIKYNRQGGEVKVSVRRTDSGVCLSVADTGIGIPPEHQERIFERFYRVDKSRSKELGGTGLGLSIVKHAASLHNAKIDLQSAEGKGTTINVTFPTAGDE